MNAYKTLILLVFQSINGNFPYLTLTQIQKLTNIKNRKTLKKYLENLEREGKIERVIIPPNKKRTVYYLNNLFKNEQIFKEMFKSEQISEKKCSKLNNNLFKNEQISGKMFKIEQILVKEKEREKEKKKKKVYKEKEIKEKEKEKEIYIVAQNDKPPNQKRKINFDFSTREWENITEENIKLWKEAYPACDIERELRKMACWLLANPEKRKVRYERFIVNWLNRTQDKGGTKLTKEEKRELIYEKFLKEGG